jgi:hypothetical protein
MISGLNLKVKIGSYLIQRVPYVRIFSSRLHDLTKLYVQLPDFSRELYREIKLSDPVVIEFNYRGQNPAVWHGTVGSVMPGDNKDQILICGTGPEKILSETYITQSWLNETPEAIIRSVIPLEIKKIASTGVVFPKFIAANLSIFGIIHSCEKTLQDSFGFEVGKFAGYVDSKGAFIWGDYDDDNFDIPVIETGGGLIKHSPAKNAYSYSKIETFLLPFLRHSMQIRIKDERRQADSYMRCNEVIHSITPEKARTYIVYGGDNVS